VLATGGCGQVYRYTTNPQVATGDGFAIAHRAGARLATWSSSSSTRRRSTRREPAALVSRGGARRGRGAAQRRGERFMPQRHRLAELAPRDVVAREIFREQQARGACSSTRARSGRRSRERFPGSSRSAGARHRPAHGADPGDAGAHYMMGGVVTDLAGRSSLARLYACGEVARTGVHGANRLASNSLLEGLVFAERVARDLEATPRLRSPCRPAALDGAAARPTAAPRRWPPTRRS
jgi:L-aspartate oxidase